MPSAQIASTTGPVELYYEDTGRGFPLVWCHEFGGDYRSWEYQVIGVPKTKPLRSTR